MAEGVRYHKKTGIYPINHCVVVRAALLEKHPWVALNVYSAFLEAKEAAAAPLAEAVEPWEHAGLLPPGAVQSLRGSDPMPYGVAANRQVFEALSTYLHEQGLVQRPLAVEELFAPSTVDL